MSSKKKILKIVEAKPILVKDILNSQVEIMKPILKWVGGKTQIIDKVLSEFPTHIDNYHEIFLGGGSVLMALLSYIRHNIITVNGKIYVYDLNQPLISLYKNIQLNVEELYQEIQNIIQEYNSCEGTVINRKPVNIEEAKTSKESYYYWIRKQYNSLTPSQKTQVYGSALFLFINKTCFRGMFRIGPNGFNIPYGNYKNPKIVDKTHLFEIHDLIQGVVFTTSDFVNSMDNITKNDFAYLDPPYVPQKNSSFVGYTGTGFNINHHLKLFEMCNQLQTKKIKFLMSNADAQLVKEQFPLSKFNIETIECRRAINSRNPGSKTNEVLITPII